MILRSLHSIASALLFVSLSSGVHAAEWYVDGSVSESGDGKTWGTAFQTIQVGIDAASDGDTVIVAEGIYLENIHFKGNNIRLMSTDPLDPDVVANTIIDGSQAGSVVIFAGEEDQTCVLSGFTIRNGSGSAGGGICGNGTHATIENNVITHNSARYYGWPMGGGGLCHCDGTIRNNVIIGNSAGWGGGLAFCGGTIERNVISGNLAWPSGGGGLAFCGGIIRNNVIIGNSAGRGGGLYRCDGTITNCIIWRNVATDGSQLIDSSAPTYSCIEGWTGGDEGNISEDPRFVDADNGNFRLLPSSPCIDAGSLSAALRPWVSLPGEGARLSWSLGEDLDGNPRISGKGIDMGAYEYQTGWVNFRVEYSSDLETWQEAITTSGLEWLDDEIQGMKGRFYRVSVSP